MQPHVIVRIYRATDNMHKCFLYSSEKLSELKGLLRGTAELGILKNSKTGKCATPTCSPFPEGDNVHKGIQAPFKQLLTDNRSLQEEAWTQVASHFQINFFFFFCYNQITAMVAETPTGIP